MNAGTKTDRQMDEALPGHSLNRQQFPPFLRRFFFVAAFPRTLAGLFPPGQPLYPGHPRLWFCFKVPEVLTG